ncbi:MAG TPA: cyclic nucleotide-binding domain-containing protein [Ramlibacter sp.]
MQSFATESRQWTPPEVAEMLIEGVGLGELSPEAAMHIVELLRTEHIAAGTVLMEEGTSATGYMAVVLEGEALVANAIEGTEEASVLGEIGPGAVYGELGILDGKPRSATVTAVTDMDIAVLDRAGLSRLMDLSPGVACSLLSAIIMRVGERLRATNKRVQDLATQNIKLKEQLAIA